MLRDSLKKHKIITLEVLLPVGGSTDKLIKDLSPFKDKIDAINIPSNPLGKLRPDSLCFGHIIQERLEVETIPHFVARHYTILIFESQLLGASALGIKNILCVTGDTPAEGRSVFEMNGARLLEIANNLKRGITSSRQAIPALDFCLCASLNPNVTNLQGEYIKVAEKCHCGTEIFFTQPVFNAEKYIGFIDDLKRRYKNLRIIAGLSYLYTKKRAFALMKFLGIPYDYIKFIEERDETEMLFETACKLKDHVEGFYIIPIGRYAHCLPLVEKLRKIL